MILKVIQRSDHEEQLKKLCCEWLYWSEEELFKALENSLYMMFALESGGEWHAVLLVTYIDFLVDIFFLYVPQDNRGRNLGLKILQEMEGYFLKRKGEFDLMLEVRSRNLAAIATYKKLGMKQISIRRGYYRDGEDALIFKKSVAQAHTKERPPSN